MRQVLQPLLCISLLLIDGSAIAAQWQHDLSLSGPVPGVATGDLRTEGNSVQVLVSAGGVLRLAQANSGGDALQWRPAQRGVEHNVATVTGWVGTAGSIDFGGIPGSCDVAGRDADGTVGLLAHASSYLGNCTAALYDADGAVVVHGQNAITALDRPGVLRWRRSGVPGVNFYAIARASDGSLWAAGETFLETQTTPLLLKLDSATGVELARWESIPARRHVAALLKPGTAGGMQAMVWIYESDTSASLQAMSWNSALQLQSRLLLASFAEGQPTADLDDNGGLAACWTQADDAGTQHLHATVLDAQLAVQWSQEIDSALHLEGCSIARSAAGRVAISYRRDGINVLVRRTAQGAAVVTEQPDAAIWRMRFGPDERLWVSTRPATEELSSHLLGVSGDAPAFDQDFDLTAQADSLVLRAAAAGNAGKLHVLVNDSRYDGALRALTVSATGVVEQPALGPSNRARQIDQTDQGWVVASDNTLAAWTYTGQLLWQRELQLGFSGAIACRADGSCAYFRPAAGGLPPQIVWIDTKGQDGYAHLLLALGESVAGINRDPRSGELLAQVTTPGSVHLHALAPEGGLLQRAVWQRANSTSGAQLIGTPYHQIVVADDAGLTGFDNLGARWTRPGFSSVFRDRDGPLWTLPADLGPSPSTLAPLDSNGASPWSWDEPPFVPSTTALWDSPYTYALQIAGRLERTSWIGGEVFQGGSRVRLGIVSNRGESRQLLELADAKGPIDAIITTDSDEAAYLVYSTQLGDQPRLRIRRIENWLFRDGLED